MTLFALGAVLLGEALGREEDDGVLLHVLGPEEGVVVAGEGEVVQRLHVRKLFLPGAPVLFKALTQDPDILATVLLQLLGGDVVEVPILLELGHLLCVPGLEFLELPWSLVLRVEVVEWGKVVGLPTLVFLNVGLWIGKVHPGGRVEEVREFSLGSAVEAEHVRELG